MPREGRDRTSRALSYRGDEQVPPAFDRANGAASVNPSCRWRWLNRQCAAVMRTDTTAAGPPGIAIFLLRSSASPAPNVARAPRPLHAGSGPRRLTLSVPGGRWLRLPMPSRVYVMMRAAMAAPAGRRLPARPGRGAPVAGGPSGRGHRRRRHWIRSARRASRFSVGRRRHASPVRGAQAGGGFRVVSQHDLRRRTDPPLRQASELGSGAARPAQSGHRWRHASTTPLRPKNRGTIRPRRQQAACRKSASGGAYVAAVLAADPGRRRSGRRRCACRGALSDAFDKSRWSFMRGRRRCGRRLCLFPSALRSRAGSRRLRRTGYRARCGRDAGRATHYAHLVAVAWSSALIYG